MRVSAGVWGLNFVRQNFFSKFLQGDVNMALIKSPVNLTSLQVSTVQAINFFSLLKPWKHKLQKCLLYPGEHFQPKAIAVKQFGE